MDKNEIIFFAVIIIAYILCALTLNIPTFAHYIFIGLILIILAITILLKYQQKYKNEQIRKTFAILAIIILALYVICIISKSWYHKTLIEPSILLIPFFGALVISWFFKNS